MEDGNRCSLIALPCSPFAIRYSPIMSIRSRKLIGTVVLFVLVTVWALLAMALAQSALTDTNFWIAALYYALAGLGWVLPAMPLIRWMLRPEQRYGGLAAGGICQSAPERRITLR